MKMKTTSLGILKKENQPWVAAVCVVLVFCKWVVVPACFQLKIQKNRVADLLFQIQSVQQKPVQYSTPQVGVFLNEWQADFPFPLEKSSSTQLWICQATPTDFVAFLVALETYLSEKPLPLQWLEMDLENQQIRFGIHDGV